MDLNQNLIKHQVECEVTALQIKNFFETITKTKIEGTIKSVYMSSDFRGTITLKIDSIKEDRLNLIQHKDI